MGALFGMNIFFSMMTVVISVVMMFFKQVLLKQAKRTSATLELAAIPELDKLYRDPTNTTLTHDNPLHCQQEPAHNVGQADIETELTELKDRNADLEDKNMHLQHEVQSMRDQSDAQLSDYKERLVRQDAEIESLKRQLHDNDVIPIKNV